MHALSLGVGVGGVGVELGVGLAVPAARPPPAVVIVEYEGDRTLRVSRFEELDGLRFRQVGAWRALRYTPPHATLVPTLLRRAHTADPP